MLSASKRIHILYVVDNDGESLMLSYSSSGCAVSVTNFVTLILHAEQVPEVPALVTRKPFLIFSQPAIPFLSVASRLTNRPYHAQHGISNLTANKVTRVTFPLLLYGKLITTVVSSRLETSLFFTSACVLFCG